MTTITRDERERQLQKTASTQNGKMQLLERYKQLYGQSPPTGEKLIEKILEKEFEA